MFVETRDVLVLLDELEAKETENERMARELLNRSGEIEGLRQRIAEVESREINLPPYSSFERRALLEVEERIWRQIDFTRFQLCYALAQTFNFTTPV